MASLTGVITSSGFATNTLGTGGDKGDSGIIGGAGETGLRGMRSAASATASAASGASPDLAPLTCSMKATRPAVASGVREPTAVGGMRVRMKVNSAPAGLPPQLRLKALPFSGVANSLPLKFLPWQLP